MEYKGFWLHPAADQEPSGKWSAKVVVEQPSVDDAEDFMFKSDELFATAQEAEEASLALGKQIVDGQHSKYRLPS